ncbi:MAG: ABC transporter substrate-binding protein [Halobacteriales archaeon]|nr:ABC transporter substrate-binding protein [Halobacteriales archaeon]
MRRAAAALTFALVAGTVLAGCANQGPSDVVRIGFFPNVTHAAALVGIEHGIFASHLAGKVRFVQFDAGPNAMEAMFAGQLDVTYVGPGPTINAFAKSNGEALRVVAGATAGGAAVVVREGAGIDNVTDLAGHRVASPGLANTQDIAFRHELAAKGLRTEDKGGDVRLSALPNSDILTLFQKGELDAAWVPEPWVTRLVHEAKGRVLLDERSLWPGGLFETTHVVASARFARDQPEELRKVLDAHIEAELFVQQHPDAARASIQRELSNVTKPLREDEAVESMSHINASWDPAAQSVRTYAQWSADLGLVQGAPDMARLWDLRVLNQALAARNLTEVRA